MNETTDATSIFAPLWRRKWLILAVGIVVAAASYLYYKRETPVYRAVTEVYLGASAEEQAPGEKVSAKSQGLTVSSQVAIINALIVEQVRQTLRAEHKAGLARGAKVTAKAPEKGEFITITGEAHTVAGAVLMVNRTAQAYIKRQKASYDRVVERAIAIARRQLRRIEASSLPSTTKSGAKGRGAAAGTPSSSSILQQATLSSKVNQLEASLGVTGAQQIKPARAATTEMVSPKPRKNAYFGFVLGLVLASIAVYLLSRFDRRLRSLAAVEGVFQSQILAALPTVGRPVLHENGQPRPSKVLLEPLRRLHSALQLGELPRQSPDGAHRVVLFISADPGDGKSTLIADLALVQRDAGERVAVVEANFRRPVQGQLLGLDGARGLAEVLAGTLPVNAAMQSVAPIQPPAAPAEPRLGGGIAATAVESRAGALFLLAGGGPVANPPALLGQATMAELPRSLAGDFDYVLLDAPSPLEVSDAMPLLRVVDGIVIVARVGHTRERSAERLVHLLAQASSAPVLGVVANCVARSDLERYGFSAPGGRGSLSKLIGR